MAIFKNLFFYAVSLGSLVMFMPMTGMQWQNLYDFLSLFVLSIAAMLGVLQFSFKDLLGLFSHMLSKQTYAPGELQKSLFLLKTLWRYLLHMALLTSVMGLVLVLANFQDMAKLGTWLALLLISGIYLLVLGYLVIKPLETRLRLKIHRSTQEA